MSVPSVAKQRSAKITEEITFLPHHRQIATKGFVAYGGEQWPRLLRFKTSSDILSSCYKTIVDILNTDDEQAAWVRCRLAQCLRDAKGNITAPRLVECSDFRAQVGEISVRKAPGATYLDLYFHRVKFSGENPAPEPVYLLRVDLAHRASPHLTLHR